MRVNPYNLHFYLLFFALGISINAMSSVPNINLPDNSFSSRFIVGNSEYFIDNSKKLTADQVYKEHLAAFKIIKDARASVIKGHTWVKMVIENQSSSKILAYLKHLSSMASSIELYKVKNDQVIFLSRSGYFYPWSERQLDIRQPTFKLDLEPGITTLLVRSFNLFPVPIAMHLANEKDFLAHLQNENLIAAMLIGIIIFAFIYNLLVFLKLRLRTYLWYILYSPTMFLALILLNGFLSRYLLQNQASYHLYVYLGTLGGLLGQIFLYHFLQEFLSTKQYAPRLDKVINIARKVVWVQIVLLQIDQFYNGEPGNSYLGILLSSIVLNSIFQVTSVVIALAKYKPAYYFLFAFLPLEVLGIIDTPYVLGIDDFFELVDWIIPMGLAIEVCLLSIALAARVQMESEQDKAQIKALNSELQIHVDDLDKIVTKKTAKIKYLMDHISVGILKINRDLRIDDEYSTAAEGIFMKKTLANLPISDVLWDENEAKSDQAQILTSSLIVSLGESFLAFDLNSNSFPREIKYKDKLLELDWNPVIEDEIIESYLLYVRDVTYIRQLELDKQKVAEEALLLTKIMKFRKGTMTEYIETELTMIKKAIDLANQPMLPEHFRDAQLANILRILHTVKGNSRSYRIDEASEIMHESEGNIAAASTFKEKIAIANEGLSKVKEILEHYLSIIEKHLPASESPKEIAEAMSYAYAVDRIQHGTAESADMNLLSQLVRFLKRQAAFSLEDLMKPLVEDLPRICSKLNKEVPKIDIDDSGLFIKRDVASRLRLAMGHLIRNSLDHGLEDATERAHLNKPIHGKIKIKLQKESVTSLIFFEDDGHGLDLKKIRDRAESIGLSVEKNIGELADLIFNSSFSTKDEVTEISGRGIGMDAVKEAIEDLGGTANILFRDPKTPRNLQFSALSSAYVKFYFVIKLPDSIFI
mgnify:CR=1 FL=1